jgi:hypothetical protein
MPTALQAGVPEAVGVSEGVLEGDAVLVLELVMGEVEGVSLGEAPVDSVDEAEEVMVLELEAVEEAVTELEAVEEGEPVFVGVCDGRV